MKKLVSTLAAFVFLGGCAMEQAGDPACPGPDCPGCPGPMCGLDEEYGSADTADDYNPVNLSAGTAVLYEVQVRAANACRVDTGAEWQRDACRDRIAPQITYRAEGMHCDDLDQLSAIRLGTLDDMMEPTQDYREGITVSYIRHQVGANTMWLMPLFPNNDAWAIPHPCDNLGSPYAVRDYLHARGTLSRRCITDGRDEHSDAPCWGNDELDELIQTAHAHGMRVILDVAVNHFGHNYQMYDYVDFDPTRERIAGGENLDSLWDYSGTDDERLVHPEILDRPEELEALAARDGFHRGNLDLLLDRCPDLEGQELVRAYNVWRVALDWERDQFPCDTQFLEAAAPGFYLGRNAWDPSSGMGDNFTNDWNDVKFLYHHESNTAHHHEFVRQREYLFRILNYWVSRGVDGFRLDHTTDYHGGMGSREWDYILSKVDYYAWRRGQARPIYLAEEFHDQMSMDRVVDIMTEGYVGDMTGRNGQTKDTWHVERILGNNLFRFPGGTYVMTALETHDEHRLTDGTGFNVWTGAGFWGIGAATRSTPMILMGAEFGEPYGLGFRRSDFLRARFEGTPNYNQQGDDLVGFYRSMINGRLDVRNRALYSASYQFLRTREGNAVDDRIFAMARWSGDGNVVFVFNNLWERDVAQSYYLPPELTDQLWIQQGRSYRLVDIISGQQLGDCITGSDLAWDFYIEMSASTRVQWLRLESCE